MTCFIFLAILHLQFEWGFFFAQLNQLSRAGAASFWPLEPRENITGEKAAWEKIRSRSRLEKKSGAGAAKKISGSPALNWKTLSF